MEIFLFFPEIYYGMFSLWSEHRFLSVVLRSILVLTARINSTSPHQDLMM